MRAAAGVLAFVAAAALAAAIFLRNHHFTAGEVGMRAIPWHGVDLPPPKGENGVDYYGKLRLDIFIAADGAVERIDTTGSTVPEAFRQEAVHAFSSVGWEPARKWGIKVPSVKRVEVDFEPPVRGLENPNVSPAMR
ncbi:MAG TPA: hypothetical protein VH040_16135 [Usitatibacter sp.]|jgi:hypothetical protein|nr:hypothetical protein [Usitatibacter sp.]